MARSPSTRVFLFALHVAAALPLREWLASLNVHLPQVTLESVLPGGIHLQVDVLEGSYCHQVQIRDIENGNSTGSATLFFSHFTLVDVGLVCHLSTVTSLHGGLIKMTTGELEIDFTVANSTLELAVQVDVDANASAPLPLAASLPACSLGLSLDYHFRGKSGSGIILAGILDALRPAIDSWAPSFAQTAVCQGGEWLLKRKVTPQLEQFAKQAKESGALLPGKPLPVPATSTLAVNLEEFLVTGNSGHNIQSALHDGLYDLSNLDAAQIPSLISEVWAIVAPDHADLPSSAQRGMNLKLPWLTLGLHAGVPHCDIAQWPSPLIAMNATEHVLTAGFGGPFSGNCSFSAGFNMTFHNKWVTADGPVAIGASTWSALERLSATGSVFLAFDSDALERFQFDQFFRLGCFREILDSNSSSDPSVKLLDWSVDLSHLRVGLQSEVEDPLNDAVLGLLQAWVNAGAASLLPGIIMLLQGDGGRLLRDFMNNATAKFIAGAPACPSSSFEDTSHPTLEAGLGSCTVALLVLGLAACSVTLGLACQRCLQKMDSGPEGPAPQPLVASMHRGALVTHPALRRSEVWGLVLFAGAALCGLLVSWFGFFIRLGFVFADEKPQDGPSIQPINGVADLNYLRVLVLMWTEGAWPLSFLIFLLGVVFPLLEVGTVLVLFFAPPSLVSSRWRGRGMTVLALTSKANLAQIFCACFLIRILHLVFLDEDPEGGADAITFGGEYRWAFYFLICTSLLIMSVLESAMRLDARAQGADSQKDGLELPAEASGVRDEPSAALAVSLRCPLCQGKASLWMRVGTWVALVSMPFLITAGLFIQAYRAEYTGMLGMAKYLMDQGTVEHYSPWNIMTRYPWPAEGTEVLCLGVGLMVVILTWFCLLAPLLHYICMMSIWVLPVSGKSRDVLTACEYALWSWQALDVFAGAALMLVLLGDPIFWVLSKMINDHTTPGVLCKPLLEQGGIWCTNIKVFGEAGVFVLLAGVLAQFAAMVLLRLQLRPQASES